MATALSVIVGVTAAFLGGLWDDLLSLTSNVFLVIPSLPLLILLLGYLPQKGQLATIVVLSVLGWPWGARVIRAQTLAIRNRDFIAASRETGERTWRIIAFEIVPNEISLIAASFVNTVLYAIGASVALAFIGLADLNSWSLGTMLYWAQSQQALAARRLVVVRAAGPRGGADRHRPGAAQHRHRRARQPAGCATPPARVRIDGRRQRPADPTPVWSRRTAASRPGHRALRSVLAQRSLLRLARRGQR